MKGEKRKLPLLGEILLGQGLIDKEQLQMALEEQKVSKRLLGEILLSHGFITEKDLFSALAVKFNLPFVSVSSYLIPPEVINLLPKDFVREYKVLPLSKEGEELTVAMIDPLNMFLLEELKRYSSCKVKLVISTASEIEQAIEQYYGFSSSIEELIKSIDKEKLLGAGERGDIEAPIVKLVNLLILQAVQSRASDIHIEPEEKFVRVRYRIDGMLSDTFSLPKDLQMPVISRIKIMANMNIAERRLPQDGRVEIKAGSRPLDIRISTQPTLFGENVVMRLLEKRQIFVELKQLGFSEETLKRYEEVLFKPYGIILVTGPTGSGKSTTLYVCLQKLNTEQKNIMTIEDPIEYQLPGVRQSQVNPKTGFDFASGLRAILRQDPDIIMVGEIRDMETAEVAVRAALTGHLVLSTLHTNDAPSAFTRLIDMGIEPFLISSAVIGVLAQRLVRVICPRCKEAYKPSEEMRAKLGLARRKKETEVLFYRGKGCAYCRKTGYYGRIGIFEFLPATPELRELILRRCSSTLIRQLAEKQGMKSLFEDGLDKVLKGITTIEEVLRVAIS
ncbi:MAG: type II secretion system protein GspE [Candidatus Omnitrophota bacterium]|nr:MAG: type II secretion system protein GspE [Candidatus Omnitrophota bacterium]